MVRGYKLELASTLIQRSPSRVIESKNSHQIAEEVHQLLVKSAIRMVTPCQSQFLNWIFVVPKKDGSHRPVINPRPLNWFRMVIHFKMESLATMRDLLRQDDRMALIDLKDAYLSVLVWEGHRKYLHFIPNS